MSHTTSFAAFLAALLITTSTTAATIDQSREFTFNYGFDLFDIPPGGTNGTGIESYGDLGGVSFDKFDPAMGFLTSIRLTHRIEPVFAGSFANTYGRGTSNSVRVNIASRVSSQFVGSGLTVLTDEEPPMLTDLILFDEGEPGPDPDSSMLSRTRFSENGPVTEFSVDLGSLPGFDSSSFLTILDARPIDYIFETVVARSVTVIPPNPCITFVGLGCAPELSTGLDVRNIITLAYDFTPRTAVPEPATSVLLIGTLLGLGGRSWRRRNKVTLKPVRCN